MYSMKALHRAWAHFEETAIAFLLAAMTLVTFTYVVLNNLYSVFYYLGDHLTFAEDFFLDIGDVVIGWAQAMTWSNALTKALFGWLIFLGIGYGVRTAGHIGVDVLVKLAPRSLQRWIGLFACLCCLGYAGLMSVASFDWVRTLLGAGIGAEDLDRFGIQQGHIALVVPIGFFLVFLRFLEIFVRILRGQQTGLGLADEAAEVMKLTEHEEPKP
jgi:C4-dicarboxylate transporter DctQ subunit